MAPSGRVAQVVNVVADGLGGVAVVAHAVLLTGGIDVEPCSIDGRGSTTGAGQGCLDGLCHLVQSDDEDDLLGTPGDGCHTVAVAVDVDDDAILGDGIGTGEIDINGEGPEIHGLLLFWRLHEIAVQHLKRSPTLQRSRNAEVADGHGTAPCHRTAVGNEFRYFLNGIAASGAIEALDVATMQILDDGLGQTFVSFFLWFHTKVLLSTKVVVHNRFGIYAERVEHRYNGC